MPKKKTAGIRKVGDRQYEIDHVIIMDGKRVHVRATGFRSAQEAKDAMPALIERKRKEYNPITSSKTIDQLVDEFIAYKETQVKIQTMNEIHVIFRHHFLPSFTGLRIPEALSFDRVAKWYRAKSASPKDSPKRKNRVFSNVRDLIDFAWKRHYVTSESHQDLMTLVENVRMPNAPRKEPAVWNAAQEASFLASIPADSIDYPMFTLFCYLGCRMGEFLGLQWKCLNERQGTITIGQQVIVAPGGAMLTTELKTNASYRVNKLDKSTLDLILKYRSTLDSSEDSEFIFPSPRNSKEPLSKTEFRRKFYRYIEKSGVPKIVPHGVRHSKATMIAGVCRNAEEIAVGAKFLGHSSTMFMETYVSNTGIDQSDLIARIGGNKA